MAIQQNFNPEHFEKLMLETFFNLLNDDSGIDGMHYSKYCDMIVEYFGMNLPESFKAIISRVDDFDNRCFVPYEDSETETAWENVDAFLKACNCQDESVTG
jgi:hypothetical protein